MTGVFSPNMAAVRRRAARHAAAVLLAVVLAILALSAVLSHGGASPAAEPVGPALRGTLEPEAPAVPWGRNERNFSAREAHL